MMGHIYIEEGVHPVSGVTLPRVEIDTVACKHCRAVIRVVLAGVTRAYDTPHRCGRCDSPICAFCARKMDQDGDCQGPMDAVIDQFFTSRGLDNPYTYRHHYRR